MKSTRTKPFLVCAAVLAIALVLYAGNSTSAGNNAGGDNKFGHLLVSGLASEFIVFDQATGDVWTYSRVETLTGRTYAVSAVGRMVEPGKPLENPARN